MNLISLIVGRLMNLRKFSGDLRFLSGAAGRWHWNSRDSGLTSKVYALFICRICRWLIGHGWTVWYNDEWHKKTCFVIHNFPTPPHHNMIISAVSHRQCQPRIEAFYDAIVSATHSKVYTLSISWNCAVPRANLDLTMVRDVLFCKHGLRCTARILSTIFNIFIMSEMTMRLNEIKICSLCCIYRAGNYSPARGTGRIWNRWWARRWS